MKLTNAYIIDGDVIEKRIAEWQEKHTLILNEYSKGNTNNEVMQMYRSRMKDISDFINELKEQYLKPALPIVEEAFEVGREGKDTFEVKADFEFTTFNDCLKTKDF